MTKKLTITLPDRVYAGLHRVIGRRRISHFIGSLVGPLVVGQDLDAAYRQMAQDDAREAEALDLAEATVGDVADEARGSMVGELRPRRRRRNPQAKTRGRRQ